MNALGSSVMGDDDVPHGTREGWFAGCRGSSCPSAAQGLSCTTAHRRYAGEWEFRKRVDAGMTPAQIVASDGGAEVVAKPKPVKRQKRAQDLGSSRPHTLRDLAETAAIVEAADEVSIEVVPDPSKFLASLASIDAKSIGEQVQALLAAVPAPVSLQVPEVWRVSDGPAFEVAEKVDPESVAAGAVGAAVPADSPIRPDVSPRSISGAYEAYSDAGQREAAAALAKFGARRVAAWAEIEAVREPSNVLILRLVELGMPQHEVAELAGISQASVNALVKTSRTKGGRK